MFRRHSRPMSQPLRDRESVLSQTGGCRHVHHRDIVFTSEFLHPATDRPSSKSPRALSCEQFFLQNRQTARRASLRSLTPPTKQTDATMSRHPHQTCPQHSPSVQSSNIPTVHQPSCLLSRPPSSSLPHACGRGLELPVKCTTKQEYRPLFFRVRARDPLCSMGSEWQLENGAPQL